MPETLTPAKTIRVQHWMKDIRVQTIMRLLNQADDQQALFVGGCVRNALLKEEVDDIDIATVLRPQDVMHLLSAEGIKVIPTGIDHGTVTAVIDGKPFEITTLRKDVETDGRRAVVEFADEWVDDSYRRDFTINTLLADLDGNIYDPLGQGLDDIEKRRIVFVGDAKARIAEDILRILRYFRFHALYADGEMEAETLKACRDMADQIRALSKERITQEFFKILSVGAPVDILDTMFENKVLDAFNFKEYNAELLGHVCEFQKRYGLGFLASRLLTLAGFEGENITAMEGFLLIPKVFKKDMQAIGAILNMPDLSDDHTVKVAIYKHGRVPAAQALMIELAQDRVMNGYAPKALDIIQNWDVPDFPVSGNDLIKAGEKPGPELGDKLNALEEEWIARGFRD